MSASRNASAVSPPSAAPASLRVSACIICCNEAQRVAAALDSLAWCADIVVVDSGSTDGTFEMAQRHASRPRVMHHDWPGYSAQREYAVSQCRNEWVLMLDADEECSPALGAEIAALDAAALDNVAIFELPRRNYLAGRYVRCWSPDYQTRLVERTRITWEGTQLPEVRRPRPGRVTRRLQGPLLHGRVGPFSPTDLVHGVKMAAYADLLARNLAARGKQATLLNLLSRPLATFIKYYLLRGGFLDGRLGLVIAYKTTIGVMLKYSMLYARELESASEPRT
jgi:(heptosyl)LPS beta-1,4-glucosyltransferase